jgi:hypothetical protein
LARELSATWHGKLAYFQSHENDEHLVALIDESARYAGLHLENDLSRSEYWSKVPLARRVAVLLFLVDKGVVERSFRRGRRVFEPLPHAESWVNSQAALRPYVRPTLELLAALRHELDRRSRSRPAGLDG